MEDQLAIKTSDDVAEQCRALGLKIGDIIIGREQGTDYWHEAELTLLWLGNNTAVFQERSRAIDNPEWSKPIESGDWSLAYRDWYKVPPIAQEQTNQPTLNVMLAAIELAEFEEWWLKIGQNTGKVAAFEVWNARGSLLAKCRGITR